MADLVDGKEKVLVGGGADNVGEHPELPGEERVVAEDVCAGNLERDDANDDVFCQWFGAAELGDLPGEFVVSLCLA